MSKYNYEMLSFINVYYDSWEKLVSQKIKNCIVKGWEKHKENPKSEIKDDEIIKKYCLVNSKHKNFYYLLMLGGATVEDLKPLKRDKIAFKSWLTDKELVKYNKIEKV